MTSSRRGGTRRRRPVLIPALAVLLASGVGVIGAFGGFAEVPDDPPPKLGEGAVLDQRMYRTRFDRAAVTVVEQEFGEPKRFLELRFTVTNQSDATSFVGSVPESPEQAALGQGFAASLLRVSPAIPARHSPLAFGLAERAETSQLHPDLATTVLVRYELEPDAVPPEQVTLDVGRYELFSGVLDPAETWTLEAAEKPGAKPVPVVAAQVTLPVRQEEG